MELVFNAVIGIILILLFVESTNFSDVAVSNDKLGASGFPQIIIVISLIILAYITFNSFKERKANVGKEKFDIKDKGLITMLVSIAILAIYIFSMDVVGFMVGTFAFSLIIVKVMGYKDTLKSIIFSLILTASITLIFGKVFFVSLPRGIGFIREISYLIY